MSDVLEFGTDQDVYFGTGIRHETAGYVSSAGVGRALVLTTPEQEHLGEDLVEALGARAAGVFAKAAMHTPVEVTAEALEHLQSSGADGIVSVGGGSTVGLGKALSLRTGVRQIALPTTYAGSECTPVLGQTENGAKTTLTDPRVLPGTVLYDPELVATLPAPMTVTSALNAMAHAVEALYAKDRSETSDRLAMSGLKAFRDSLPKVVTDPHDLGAREETQRGAWACGTVLGRVGMALHHKLCHTLGGTLNLPHAETHAIVLPHAIAYNAEAVPDLLAPVAAVFGDDDPARAVWDFAKALDAPIALKDLEVSKDDLDRVADLAVTNPYWNPREIDRDGILALLGRAWNGDPPAA